MGKNKETISASVPVEFKEYVYEYFDGSPAKFFQTILDVEPEVRIARLRIEYEQTYKKLINIARLIQVETERFLDKQEEEQSNEEEKSDDNETNENDGREINNGEE